MLIDVPFEEREVMCEAEPEVYFFTDHYRDWPAVLARLPAAAPEHVHGYLERAWRKRAPKKRAEESGGVTFSPCGRRWLEAPDRGGEERSAKPSIRQRIVECSDERRSASGGGRTLQRTPTCW